MKNNKGFDKKNKNKIYNEKTFFQIMKSVFPDKYKNNMNPVKYNEYMDKYIEISYIDTIINYSMIHQL